MVLLAHRAVHLVLAAHHRADQPLVTVVADAAAQVAGRLIFREVVFDDLVDLGGGDKVFVERLASIAELADIHGLVVLVGADIVRRGGRAVGDKYQPLHFFDIRLSPADHIRDFVEGGRDIRWN